jgi:hypothetical protein
MGDYTFTIEARELSGERSEILHYDNDADAIFSGRDMLAPSHLSVGVGRGVDDAVEWLGAWDWCDGKPRWAPEE